MKNKFSLLMIKAAIFDVDGTILDSMGTWEDAMIELIKENGIVVDENVLMEISSASEKLDISFLNDMLGKTEDEVDRELNRIVATSYETRVKTKPGIHEVLELFKQQGIRMCISTNTYYDVIMKGLRSNHVDTYFEKIFTPDICGTVKENPEFLDMVLNYLGEDRREIVIFDDAMYSIRQGNEKQLITVGMYDKSAKNNWDELCETADFHYRSFTELLEELKE